ncbi:tetratricopeptide repeat protein [Funiculus sociatus GB2-A5]|uniref:Tetratricopeptide repeat protein n=1 Tax=Funiculus sociatus GB2-A5 TaxID=2933946 RepID=A0ABV0JHT6_9CYAN|nr:MULTISPECIES: tetratricopeptide repeat protein [unclassified Trichocoleus]MBD1904463.1 tetratricopeptide repeat protein [Trichocoleus sp. FACHB-832]
MPHSSITQMGHKWVGLRWRRLFRVGTWSYKNTTYYSDRGNVLYNQNKLEEAIASSPQATQLDPNNSRAYNNLLRSDRCLSSSFKFTRYARSTSCFGSQ